MDDAVQVSATELLYQLTGEALISREEVAQVLRAWQQGSRTPLDVWQWAQDAKQHTPADALVRDLVDCLVTLPFDLLIADDAAVMLDALANPVEETDLSINLLWNHLDGIATDARRGELRDDAFYGQFCDGMD